MTDLKVVKRMNLRAERLEATRKIKNMSHLNMYSLPSGAEFDDGNMSLCQFFLLSSNGFKITLCSPHHAIGGQH